MYLKCKRPQFGIIELQQVSMEFSLNISITDTHDGENLGQNMLKIIFKWKRKWLIFVFVECWINLFYSGRGVEFKILDRVNKIRVDSKRRINVVNR